MADSTLLDEYILNDEGAIFTGSDMRQFGRPWNFGQVTLVLNSYIYDFLE